MSDFKERLEEEKRELDGRINRLATFIGNDKFKTIDPQQQVLLAAQLPIMRSYAAILQLRLDLLS